MESPNTTPEYFEALLVPENLTRPCCIDKEVIKAVFPKPFIVEYGLFKIPSEYIVMSDVGISLDFLEVGKKYSLKKDGHIFNVEVKRKNKCGSQARTFVLLEDSNDTKDLRGMASFDQLDVFFGANIIGQIHPGPTNGSGSSEGYPNAYGINKPVIPSSQPDRPENYKYPKPEDESCSINVAVLDTGLLHNSDEQTSDYSAHIEGSCEKSHIGWNFVDDNFDTDDKHPESHGTRISLIIQQVCKAAKIIPVKTAQDSGACELYDVLCGLEYARINEARIINASFSFKIDPGKRIPLLKTMMNALKEADIWVIAAAGNAGQYNRDAMGQTPPLGKNAPLNLPACYSRDSTKNRVLTVTTVSCTRKIKHIGGRLAIKPTDLKLGECYSKKFVDVGAIANGAVWPSLQVDDHTFAAPDFPPRPGTSYATPYITGLVASILQENYVGNKKELMRALRVEQYRKLRNGIRHGNCIEV